MVTFVYFYHLVDFLTLYTLTQLYYYSKKLYAFPTNITAE